MNGPFAPYNSAFCKSEARTWTVWENERVSECNFKGNSTTCSPFLFPMWGNLGPRITSPPWLTTKTQLEPDRLSLWTDTVRGRQIRCRRHCWWGEQNPWWKLTWIRSIESAPTCRTRINEGQRVVIWSSFYHFQTSVTKKAFSSWEYRWRPKSYPKWEDLTFQTPPMIHFSRCCLPPAALVVNVFATTPAVYFSSDYF